MEKTYYEKLFDNNKEWVASKLEMDPEFFSSRSEEQHPPILYIGCADSRVPANEIMGLDSGEVFVTRNVANLVPALDMSIQSVIQYAVDNLKVKHIIVCGHYGCGGVKASMQHNDLGLLNKWLRGIRDVYRLHQDELNAIKDQEERYRRLVELNVQEQCINVIKSSFVQKHYYDRGAPVVHGWVFDLNTGCIKDLEIDFTTILENVMDIYRINSND